LQIGLFNLLDRKAPPLFYTQKGRCAYLSNILETLQASKCNLENYTKLFLVQENFSKMYLMLLKLYSF